jgi:hypothetical protein
MQLAVYNGNGNGSVNGWLQLGVPDVATPTKV